MTRQQFKAIRRALGLSQNEMARLIGVSSDRTVRRWEDGGRAISETADEIMSLLKREIVDIADLEGAYAHPCSGPYQIIRWLLKRGIVTPDDLQDL